MRRTCLGRVERCQFYIHYQFYIRVATTLHKNFLYFPLLFLNEKLRNFFIVVMRGRVKGLARFFGRRARGVGARAESVSHRVGSLTYGQLGMSVAGSQGYARHGENAIVVSSDRGFAASAGTCYSAEPSTRQPAPSADSNAAPATQPLDTVMEVSDSQDLQSIVTAATEKDVALVFDFYADWCQPCKQLTPKLAASVESQPGKEDGTPNVILVKINVDKHSGISDELQIKSLPTVMAMRGGKLVDSFTGVIADPDIDKFIQKATAATETPTGDTPIDTSQAPNTPDVDPTALVDQAFAILDAPENRDPSVAVAAAELVNAALASGPEASPATIARAYAAAARCALLSTPIDLTGAEAMLDAAKGVVGGTFAEPGEMGIAGGLVQLAKTVLGSGRGEAGSGSDSDGVGTSSQNAYATTSVPSSDSFRQVLETLEAAGGVGDAPSGSGDGSKDGPNELDAVRRAHAAALCLEGESENAVAAALDATKKGNREYGRETCVMVFDALGDKHPVVVAGRRKLANLWFV